MRDSPLDHRYFYCLMCMHVCKAKKKNRSRGTVIFLSGGGVEI